MLLTNHHENQTISPGQGGSFVPKLEFTDRIPWENIYSDASLPELTLELRAVNERKLHWHPPAVDGRFSATFEVDAPLAFRISGYRNQDGLIPACNHNISGGVILWIESIETKAVLSAPVLPYQCDDNLMAYATIPDPGEYRAHVAGYDISEREKGAHGTIATVLAAKHSPYYFTVKSASDELMNSNSTFNLPRRKCQFSDLEGSGQGRWVECAAAGISRSECLADGWIFIPNHCRHTVTTSLDTLEQSRAIAEKRHGQPVWIVFTGTSVDRGSFHALVDHVAAVGMLEGGAMNRSVADALFEDVEDRRGRGSTTKCWGWIDVQVGSIRLSYQDARLHIHADKPRWINAAKRRWGELLSEGPDLVIFGIETNDNGPDETMRLYNRVTSQIVEAAATTQFRGLVAINPTKARIKNGGIKTAYEYMSGEPRSSVDNIRRSLDNAFDQCKSCEGIARENFIIPDELIMGWSFLFDMERPMSDKLASQHFHRYATKAVPQSGCGSRYTNKRYVIGAVVEMAYISVLFCLI
jgi:hypothetical protein